ncbi:MAG TPA: hypothetical protein VGL53_22060, partial [Bryobacteraceae bacterium]
IAVKYQPLTPRQSKLAIDINVVERYQDVYPTKQQTGTELFQLVNTAAHSFPRVALYFEQSILSQDLPLLASAAAAVDKVVHTGSKTLIDSPGGVGVPWTGAALVDGQAWPMRDATTLWIPAGKHTIEPGGLDPSLKIEDFNGSVKSAVWTGKAIELAYESQARVFCRLSRAPVSLEIDGEPVATIGPDSLIVLPRGQHVVSVH